MKTILLILSLAGLALVICPPVLYLAGAMTKAAMISWMLAGTILWFVTAPLWMPRPGDDGATAGPD